MAASVKMKDSMVAMSGATMPLPLAMPAIRTSVPPRRATRVAALGKVSVVMIARAASARRSSVELGVQLIHHRDDFVRGQGLADDAGGGEENRVRVRCLAFRSGMGGGFDRADASDTVENIGVAGIDDEAAGDARLPGLHGNR